MVKIKHDAGAASNLFPDGLASSSGQVGRNYMRRMTRNVYGVFEKPAHMHRGTTEDMPRKTNRITLDPAARDKLGMPVASAHFDDHPNDVAMRPRTPPWAPQG